ncbi:STAS domain-containing protein [Rhodococcus cercidiphylli]|jgi:anti-sigma B factor antagonist|uniref:Anti-sigma factor antagonist n=1 Tax=Rhodococcus cercidiphylli TaxID=489916 RepID=A0ABU4AV16_9NOCA|nr:STAS domain-containing protein [Rhodococcus cercidiphylli]MDV6230076.1 STAS domain-containing protein [Rhodococcus cercidiphylli]
MNEHELLGLDVTSEKRGDTVVLSVEGEVDLATASDLADHIERAMRTTPTAMIVDLTAVSFLASVGMSVLIAARRKACCTTPLVVVAAGPTTGRPMHLVGLDAAIPIFTDVESALESTRASEPTRLPVSADQADPTSTCSECSSGESTDSAFSA